MPFNGVLSGSLNSDVLIENKPATSEGSIADNTPAHVPAGGPFQRPPSNQGAVKTGSAVVLINNRKAARAGDTALT